MGMVVSMRLNPPGQYADDRNLYARQRLWQHQVPFFDVVGWVLDLAGLAPGMRVLDAGCGNGAYLRALAGYPVRAAGCDLSAGMLRAVPCPALFCADVAALPVRDGSFASVALVRPARQSPVVIRDASVAADYVASFYQDQVARPWADVVAEVR
jgi:SAM-dependent methyltransferase